MLKRLFYLGITFFANSLLYGQPDNITFHAVSEGLSQHTVSSLLQDSKGFLWVGTRNGLNKYNGLDFQVYHHILGDSTSISNATIQCLTEDKKGNIWIGTYGGGLNFYNYDEDRFYSYNHNQSDPNSLSSNFVLCVFEDYDGDIWIGTENGGLNLLNKEKGVFQRFLSNNADPSSIGSNNVTSINQDNNGNIWIATYGGGISMLNKSRNQFITFKKQNTEGLQDDITRTIYKLDNGTLLFGTQLGAKELIYDKGHYSFKNLLTGDPLAKLLDNARVLSISEDTYSRIWIGTENEGLFCIDRKADTAQHFYHTSKKDYGIQSNSIWSILKGDHGKVWIGTYNLGLFKIDQYEKKFNNPIQSGKSEYNLSHNVVSSFAEDRKGNLWIGTDNGGLNYFNRSTNKISKLKSDPTDPNSLSNNAVVSIMLDKKDNLWVGTWGGGISVLPSGKADFRHFSYDKKGNSISGNDIYDFHEDSQGRIWIAAFREGLDVYLPESDTFHNFDQSIISSLNIRSIYEDYEGYIWVGTEGAGINKIKVDGNLNVIEQKNYIKNGLVPTGLLNNTIINIFQDSDSVLWIGTEGGGLHSYDRLNDTFSPIISDLLMTNNVINGILEDDNKNLWMSTNNGLVRFNKETKAIDLYNETDGLQSSEFFKSSCYKTKDGHLLFGGIKGFNMFLPQAVMKNPIPPTTYITSFSLSDQVVKCGVNSPLKRNILNTNEIELNHDQNDFSFEFVALNYSQTNKNTYAYKLENYDDKWLNVNTRNKAYYTNVPPGKYIFKVRGANNDGIWAEKEASLIVDIAKPWHATYWAYSGYALIFLATLLWARHAIVYRERLKAQLKLDHVELKKMQELDHLKSRFFANISHEFRTPLSLIIAPLKSLYLDEVKNEYRQQIRMMIRNAERLLRLINQILDLSKIESGKMGLKTKKMDLVSFLKSITYSFSNYADKQFVTYSVELPKEPVFVYFDRDKIEKVVTNLVSNAIKYTPEFGKVNIDLSVHKESVKIFITDTGIGIPQDKIAYIFNRFYRAENESDLKGTGIGLALTKELVELHKGQIEVTSAEGKGTTFIVTLPLGMKHLEPKEISEKEVPEPRDYKHEQEDLLPNNSIVTPKVAMDKTENDLFLILVVEDNDEMRSFITSYLEINYKIIECSNGKEALQLAKEQIPDIIVSDVMMPQLDGYNLCKLLKNDEKTSHIPIILLSAKASDESIEEGFELGANYYVTKPFNPKLLELRIKNILNSRKMFKEQVLTNKTVNLEPEHVVISSADEKFIKRAIQIVQENIDNSELQVEHLCMNLGMSKIQLYRKLKGLIGQSANEFIRNIRLKRAAQLLKQKSGTVAEITYQVGFNDLQYFRECFKKQYGVNPSDFAQ